MGPWTGWPSQQARASSGIATKARSQGEPPTPTQPTAGGEAAAGAALVSTAASGDDRALLTLIPRNYVVIGVSRYYGSGDDRDRDAVAWPGKRMSPDWTERAAAAATLGSCGVCTELRCLRL